MDDLRQILQWDLGVTAIDALNKIGALIKVTAQDKVHPQACFAAIEIGNLLECSPTLIGRGREPMNPKSNLQSLNGFGISLGLLPKSTASILSTSPGGIKVFLLICGLKLWLKEPGAIGDVLFQIAIDADTGIQDRQPTSASELGELTEVLLAYTPELTKNVIKHLEQISLSIQVLCEQLRAPVTIYDVPPAEYTAALLTGVFRSLRNEEFCRITLIGSVSATWIGTLLSWLLPDDVAFVSKDYLIWGQPKARMTIELEERGKDTAEWKIQRWTETSMEAIVAVQPFEGSQTPHFIPRTVTRQFLKSHRGFSDDILDVIGQASGVVVKVLVEVGTIQGQGPKQTTTLERFIGKDATANYESIISEFGWNRMEIDSKLYNAFLKQGLSYQQAVPVQSKSDRLDNFLRGIEFAIRQTYHHFPADKSLTKDILELVVLISTTALGSLFLEETSGNDIAEYNSYTVFDYTTMKDRRDLVADIVDHSGMPFGQFYKSIFACILCVNNVRFAGKVENIDDIIVVGREGLVLYPRILLSPNIEQQGAFNLALHRGFIRLDKLNHQRYRYVREMIHPEHLGGRFEVQPVNAFSGSRYNGLVPKTDWMVQEPEFFVGCSIEGDSILVKPTLRVFHKQTAISSAHIKKTPSVFANTSRFNLTQGFTPPSHEVYFRYLEALSGLIGATYVRRSGTFSSQAEVNLAKQLREELDQTVWLCPSSTVQYTQNDYVKYMNNDSRFIAYTDHRPLLALYRLSTVTMGASRYVLVEPGCNLIKAIQQAEKESRGGWVMIV